MSSEILHGVSNYKSYSTDSSTVEGEATFSLSGEWKVVKGAVQVGSSSPNPHPHDRIILCVFQQRFGYEVYIEE